MSMNFEVLLGIVVYVRGIRGRHNLQSTIKQFEEDTITVYDNTSMAAQKINQIKRCPNYAKPRLGIHHWNQSAFKAPHNAVDRCGEDQK
ncbi:unnamed protein product [Cercopithifilaria johnstoni]|uniref:Uncharacterized protein n=1 Tax=Cercopithifilaria johnstoni TaxID=2874296 RepID=A0A8J2MPH0_9BILA|nr:unnamed protein product [Cercopithifilaria johnstoni]